MKWCLQHDQRGAAIIMCAQTAIRSIPYKNSIILKLEYDFVSSLDAFRRDYLVRMLITTKDVASRMSITQYKFLSLSTHREAM